MQGFYCLVILGLTLLSCSDSSKTDKEVIKAMEKSLIRSNNSLESITAQTLHRLREKTQDPATKYRADEWYPKAERIALLSDAFLKYTEELKNKTPISPEQSDILYREIKKHLEEVLQTDVSLKRTFSDPQNFYPIETIIDSSKNVFFNTKIKHSTKETQVALLTSIQNQIRNFAFAAITFCYDQIPTPGDYYDSYSVLLGQNANILRQGDKLEINAGVGVYSKKANPEITINGENCLVNEMGYALYEKKINAAPGIYSIPVKIKFTAEYGKEEILEKTIQYTVAKECGQ